MAKKRRTEDELACLPKFLRWVGEHPLMGIKVADVGAKERKWEREYLVDHPCPSRLARNLLSHCRKGNVQTDRYFQRVINQWGQSARKKRDEIASEEDVAIADLEVAKAAALGAIKV